MPAPARHRKLLAEAIRRYRKKADLTQAELAERADLHHNFIGEIERGEKTISVDALFRIARALRVHLEDLMRGI